MSEVRASLAGDPRPGATVQDLVGSVNVLASYFKDCGELLKVLKRNNIFYVTLAARQRTKWCET